MKTTRGESEPFLCSYSGFDGSQAIEDAKAAAKAAAEERTAALALSAWHHVEEDVPFKKQVYI